MTRLLPLLAIMALFLGLAVCGPRPGHHRELRQIATYTREIDENTGADQDAGSPVTASDTESDALTYTLGGAAAASFEIVSTSGQIQTKAGVTYDHEAKSDLYRHGDGLRRQGGHRHCDGHHHHQRPRRAPPGAGSAHRCRRAAHLPRDLRPLVSPRKFRAPRNHRLRRPVSGLRL